VYTGQVQVSTVGGTINPVLAGGRYTPVNGLAEQISAANVALSSGSTHRYELAVPFAVLASGTPNGFCTGEPGNGLFNSANVTGSASLGSTACGPIETTDAEIRLVKTVRLGVDNNGNNYGDVGDVLFFDFTITNTGTTPLTSVRLLDPRVTDLSCSVTTQQGRRLAVLFADDVFRGPFEPLAGTALLPGDSITCTASHTLRAQDVAARRFDNTAVATGVGPQGQVVDSVSTAIFTSFL
jgi:uncharacterized repeat protein (TIGR01451 family)